MQKKRSPNRPMTPIAPTTPPTMAPVLDEDEDVDGLTEAGMVVNVDTSLVTMTVEPTAFVEVIVIGTWVEIVDMEVVVGVVDVEISLVS